MKTTKAELEVSDEAMTAYHHLPVVMTGSEHVRAIATPVVVAELRRLATHWANLRCTSMDVIEALHQRADELGAGQ